MGRTDAQGRNPVIEIETKGLPHCERCGVVLKKGDMAAVGTKGEYKDKFLCLKCVLEIYPHSKERSI